MLGRQPNSEVWVINWKVQIDADGLIIPPNERAYVFSPRLENKVLVDPPMVKTPLSTDGMQQLVKAMREFHVWYYVDWRPRFVPTLRNVDRLF